MQLISSPVYPIVPSYKPSEDIDVETTEKYITYLQSNGAKVVMTTAGTSQFNLMRPNDIRMLNNLTTKCFQGAKILGIPAVTTKDVIQEIEYLNDFGYENTYVMILFPDRYYTDQEIVDWAFRAADASNYPVFLHGMSIKRSDGGTYNYTADLYSRLSHHKNIVGAKEETESLDSAFNVVSGTTHPDFVFIVAGGSLRRFLFLQAAGATTFLSGVGSIFPQIEEHFFNAYINKDLVKCNQLIQEYETPLFSVFMSIGWHPCLRAALQVKGLCKGNRLPFARITESDKYLVKELVEKIENKWIQNNDARN